MSEKFGRLFLTVEVLDNRVEVSEGMWPFKKKQTIPFSNIASVNVARFSKRLVIETSDGDDYKYGMGFIFGGREAEKTRQAIAAKL